MNRFQPTHPRLDELFRLWFKFSLMQLEIIDRPNPTEAEAWETAAATIHQGSADGAERTGHRVARADRLVRRVGAELVLTANVD